MTIRSAVFFDIDGTLLNHRKELPASAREAIVQLKERGHEVAIATGRAPFMFEELRRDLGIHTYVSYNGQYVVLDGNVLYTNPLDFPALEKLTEAALRNGHPVVYMDHEDMKANVPEHSYITESIKTLKINRFPGYDPDYYKGRELYQGLLFCSAGEEQPYEREFAEFDFVRWHPFSVDILPKGGSKAVGVAKLVERMGIDRERIYAFGDGLNDIEMLSAVRHGVAMGNAAEQAKKAAKYITKSAEDDGIWHGLRMVGLL
jgi:hypothetical protein